MKATIDGRDVGELLAENRRLRALIEEQRACLSTYAGHDARLQAALDRAAYLAEAVTVRDKAATAAVSWTGECLYCGHDRPTHFPDCPTVTHPLEPAPRGKEEE